MELIFMLFHIINFVISGIGVRGYYEKFGYVLENNYMIKKI